MAGTITATVKSRKGLGIVRLKAALTTDASGVVTAGIFGNAFGRIVGVLYDAGDLDTGADITVTDSDTGATIFSLTNAGTSDRSIRPTAIVTTSAGVAITAATTANDVNRDIYVAGPLKIAVAQGGNAKSGSLTLIVQEG